MAGDAFFDADCFAAQHFTPANGLYFRARRRGLRRSTDIAQISGADSGPDARISKV